MLGVALACSVLPASALDPSKTLTQYAHRIWGQEEGLFQPTIYSILQTRDGFLWLGTQDSLIRFDGMHFREFDRAEKAGFQHSLIRALLEDLQGNLWVGSIGSGVAKISPSGAITRYTKNQGLPSDSVFCLASDSNGRIWICTNQGLAQLDHDRIRVFTTADGLPTNGIRATCQASDGTRWVAGLDFPLSRYNGSRFETYSDSQISARDTVTALECATDGSTWIGKTSGLTQIRGGSSRTFTLHDGLPDNAVSSLREGPDGSLWVGTNDGISRYRNGEFSVYRTRDGLSHSSVLSLYVDREGSLWAGTKDGLDQFTDGKLTPYSTNEGMLSSNIGPVIEDAAGQLWIGTLDRGLNWFGGHAFHALTTKDGLMDNTVLSLDTANNGDVLAGTKLGLNRISDHRVVATYPRAKSPSAAETHLPGITYPVDCYYNDPVRNSEWMGTLGSGLLRRQNGTLTHVRVKDGLYDNRIYSILRDDQFNFWMASSKGIFRISEKELEDFSDGKIRRVSSIPFSTGQLRFECQSGVHPAACRTRDGRLWFSTTNGLVVVDPNRLKQNHVAPPAQITAMIVNGLRIPARPSLRLNPSEKNVEIRFAGLSFVSPEKVTFRYILDGYDKKWTDAGPRREAFFTNLPPGKFHFRVMARNADGVWSTQPASIAFEIEPRIYQRAWFFPLLAIAILAAIAAGFRVRIRQLKKRFDLILAERTRIARELHDTLLQGLSGITMQMEALWTKLPASTEKRALADIIKDAGRCSREARQSLWDLREIETENLTFSEKLRNFSERAVGGHPISLSLKLDDSSLKMPPASEYEVLRIVQEAISNALRHAHATRLEIRLQEDNGQLQLTIEDDGIGFASNVNRLGSERFGVLGMRERAREIGAELTLTSSPGDGTRVCIGLPLSLFPAESNFNGPLAHQQK